MLNVAVSFISGLITFNFLPFFPVSLSIIFFSITVFLVIKHRENIKRAVLIILMFIFGIIYGSISDELPPELKFPDEEVFVEGIIADVPEKSEGKVRFALSDAAVNGKDIPGKVRLYIFQDQFGERAAEDLISPGDRVGAVSILKEPGVYRNPGVYSYNLRKDGIIAVGYIRYMRFSGGGRRLADRLYKKRQMLGNIIDSSLSRESAGLHRAIVPGLKRSIDLETREAFSKAGLAHLLSISGTHFGLLAFIIFGSVRRFVKCLPAPALTKMTLYITPSQIAVIATLPVLFLYALISGSSIPTVRSLIMVIIYMLALFLGRKGQWLNSLSIAALIILIWQPDAVYDLSFQLSFIAVLSIGYVLEARGKGLEERQQTIPIDLSANLDMGTKAENRQQKLIMETYEKLKTGILMTIAAVMGTAPVAALVFKQFPLIAPVTNLFVTPLICFVILPLGFFTGFSALLLNVPSMPLNWVTDAVTGFALWLVTFFSRLPYANFHIHDPSSTMIACYYISLFLIFKRGLRSRSKWELLPMVVVIIWYLSVPYQNGNTFKVTFLDVGQGEAAQVDLPDNKVMLIDGGSERPDMGRMVVAPFLWARGIKKIDYVVLSHQHADHAGGLAYILDNFDIGEVWLNGRRGLEAEGLFRKIKRDCIPFRVLKRGDLLETGEYAFRVLHPYDEFHANSVRGGFSDQNSDSLVMRIESNGLSVLFNGDIEEEAEWDLLHLGRRLESDVIKVPHHGGRTSSSVDFINAVKPDVAVISAGSNNRFGHPHYETLKRYRAAGTRIFRTDIDGAITITPGDGAHKISTYQDTIFKKVEKWGDEVRNLRLLF